ncbi:MAG: hypothetical protein B6I20_14775 [Bacteroidetes bacterium 4572_117]|nr:MAG: hypothetical protein B6I20_14775 [Bacteroidetes bacterium 4572_117]
MVIFSVSWRNVWRNKLRSLVIITAIAIGVSAGVFIIAFMQGISDQRIESAIKTEISFIQLHNPEFEEAQDIKALIENVSEKKKNISEIQNVSGQSERIVINGMAASAETSSGVRLYGINTEDEFKVTNINEKLLQRLTMFPENSAHEIVVNLDNQEFDKVVKADIATLFPELEIKLWTEIKPELAYLTEVMGMYMYIFVGIILFALGFGIVNTMLMVVLERVKEIGMLLAVGMNRMRVFKMIVLETVFLSLTGGFAGIIIGSLVSQYYSVNAIDLSIWSEGLGAIGWGSKAYTNIDFETIISITLMVIATGILAAIYPAKKALKLNPADALRTE